MSSSSDEEVCYIKNCRKSSRCYEAEKINVSELVVSGCLIYQFQEADPDYMRAPNTVTSTTTGSTTVNLNNTVINNSIGAVGTPVVVNGTIVTTNTIGNISPTVTITNAFIPSPPLPIPRFEQIPQGIFNTNSNIFFGQRMPNYVNILETRNISMIESYRCARNIRSKIYIQNISGFNTYNVAFVLIAYSNDGFTERLEILDMDVKTITAGQFNTYRVNWQRGDSCLPIQNDSRQVVIQTSVLLVNQVFESTALADLRTPYFNTQSLKLKIILQY